MLESDPERPDCGLNAEAGSVYGAGFFFSGSPKSDKLIYPAFKDSLPSKKIINCPIIIPQPFIGILHFLAIS